MRLLPLGLSLATLSLLPALGACVHAPPLGVTPIPATAQPRFDAIAFFTGRSEGEGRLAKVFSSIVPTRVESSGTVTNGVLHLVQTIHEGAKPARTREWAIREDRPGHYTGTLSDAEGPVTGETVGNRLHLAFTMNGVLPAAQWQTLSHDGRRAYNVLTVRKAGLTVAVLSEDIRKLD